MKSSTTLYHPFGFYNSYYDIGCFNVGNKLTVSEFFYRGFKAWE